MARYSIAFPVMLWSFIAPAFWTSSAFGLLPSVSLGSIIATRLLGKAIPSAAHDKTTFVYWNAWIISIETLPVWTQLLRFVGPKSLQHALSGCKSLIPLLKQISWFSCIWALSKILRILSANTDIAFLTDAINEKVTLNTLLQPRLHKSVTNRLKSCHCLACLHGSRGLVLGSRSTRCDQ